MLKTMRTIDDVTLFEPRERKVHRHNDQAASGRAIEARVIELTYDTFTLLTAKADDGTFDFIASAFLAGIAALRVAEGMTLVAITDTSAHLTPA